MISTVKKEITIQNELLSKIKWVYDFRTKVIYYVAYNGKKIAFRHPYLNENGKYCRFIDGNFVEIP